MLPSSPTKTVTDSSCHKTIRNYSDQCKLEIFLHLCQLNYVGLTNIDIGLNTLEVCSHISELKQVYCKGGRTHHDTPDELFDRFSVLAVSLPANSSGWSVQLCSCYLAALSKDLAEHVTTESTFVMPDLTKLTTKALQINALREIRQHASTSFKILNKRKDTLKELLREMNPTRNRGTNLGTHGYCEPDTASSGSSLAYQQGGSIAEQTISQYSQGSSRTAGKPVETRKHPETGLEHPFDKDHNYLSRFPVDFKGCFNCGQTDHFSTRNCAAANNGDFNKQMFFNEMWAHKPHTKKPPRQFDSGHDRGSSYLHTNQNGNNHFNRNGHNSNNNQHHSISSQNGSQFTHQGPSSSHYGPATNGNKRNIDNTPSWMRNDAENGTGKKVTFTSKKDDGSQRSRIMVLTGTVLTTTPAPSLRPMPLSLDNCLPAAIIRFGSSSND